MAEETTTGENRILIDLGRTKSKRVKQLRRGRGKLLDRVTDALDGLQCAGKLDPKIQTVIVLVTEKRR
jgi:hypothetical protein